MVKLQGKVDQRDKQASKDRRDLRWGKVFESLLFPEEARRLIEERRSVKERRCSMCGDLCALDQAEMVFRDFLSDEKKST